MNGVLKVQEDLAEETDVSMPVSEGQNVSDESVPPSSDQPAEETAPALEVVTEAAPETAEAVGEPVAEASEEAPAAEEGINPEHMRMCEALLFASAEPLSEEALKASLPEGSNVAAIIAELQKEYEGRGVNLVRVAEKWQFRTAADLAFLLRKEKPEQKKLSRAAIETLAIIAYHQPVTRAEIEDIRGVMLSKGTLDTLMEVGWIKIRGRKRTPGRPVTYGTTEAFLVQFGLENISHLPGMEELKAAGFLEAVPPNGLDVPTPSDQLGPDEDPYEGPEEAELATGGADPFMPGSSE
ncbi:SMC-Scp complex subunit ScpB [Rhizomicrobium electricum]|uniref:SMC-Scp complex subunit ScpB n=1 Tax=Rhizomicrobium electricum TaxID=480070 RepID=A0ABP3P550_9PROT|nr:SMC-Scp complex subunit ScpB [Rhizomicrobium electricum]NIJ47371.1 segregation and condensation protein B [Rhizomicrobium electricum]